MKYSYKFWFVELDVYSEFYPQILIFNTNTKYRHKISTVLFFREVENSSFDVF